VFYLVLLKVILFFSFILSRYLITYTEYVECVEFYLFVYKINEESHFIFIFKKQKGIGL